MENLINYSEFVTNKVADSLPIRNLIDDDLNPKMRKLLTSLVKKILGDNFSSPGARKDTRKLFTQIKNVVAYTGNPEQFADAPASVKSQNLQTQAIKFTKFLYWLKYLNYNDLYSQVLNSAGIAEIKFSPEFMAQYSDYQNVDITIIDEMVGLQHTICGNSNAIRIDKFNELPREIRYDKDFNPIGIHASKFVKLVKTAAGSKKESKKQKQQQATDLVVESSIQFNDLFQTVISND